MIMNHTTRFFVFFFFNDTATTEIYTLSLHDALPISLFVEAERGAAAAYPRSSFPEPLSWLVDEERRAAYEAAGSHLDRKSTRLNSSHQIISYAVFCLKKKK